MSDEWPSRRALRRLDREVALVERNPEEPIEGVEYAAHEAWINLVGQSGYLPVLLLIFLSMISIPLIGDSHVGVMINIILAGCGLLLTIYRSTQQSRARRASAITISLVTALALVAVVLVTEEAEGHSQLTGGLTIIYLVILLICFPLVLVRSFQHRRVSLNTVCATLTAYLLIGLIFMTMYRLFGQFTPFFAQTPTAPATAFTGGQYAYFSFMTLTTVGYGDLTPGSDPARSIVMVEAVIGQVFLVTTMARVISLLGEERRFGAFTSPPPTAPPAAPPATTLSTLEPATSDPETD